MGQLPLIHSLTRLNLNALFRPKIALLLPLITSLHELSITMSEGWQLDIASPLHFPSTLRHLTFLYNDKFPPLIIPKELTHLSMDGQSMKLEDIMKECPHLHHVEYRNSGTVTGPLLLPQSSIVKWKSFDARISKHELPLITSCMPSLTTLTLTITDSFDELAPLFLHLPPSLVNIHLRNCYLPRHGGTLPLPSSPSLITLSECRELELFDMNQDLADRLILPNLNTFILGNDDHMKKSPINLVPFFLNAPLIRTLKVKCLPFALPLASSSLVSKSLSNSTSTITPHEPLLSLQSLSIELPFDYVDGVEEDISEEIVTKLIKSKTLKSLSIRGIGGEYDITHLIPSLLQLSSTLTSLTFINCDHQPIIELVRPLEPILCHLRITRVDYKSFDEAMIDMRNEMMKEVPYLAEIDFY
jgi:hypothetical protein